MKIKKILLPVLSLMTAYSPIIASTSCSSGMKIIALKFKGKFSPWASGGLNSNIVTLEKYSEYRLIININDFKFNDDYKIDDINQWCFGATDFDPDEDTADTGYDILKPEEDFHIFLNSEELKENEEYTFDEQGKVVISQLDKDGNALIGVNDRITIDVIYSISKPIIFTFDGTAQSPQ